MIRITVAVHPRGNSVEAKELAVIDIENVGHNYLDFCDRYRVTQTAEGCTYDILVVHQPAAGWRPLVAAAVRKLWGER